jgi:hypothetical protein
VDRMQQCGEGPRAVGGTATRPNQDDSTRPEGGQKQGLILTSGIVAHYFVLQFFLVSMKYIVPYMARTWLDVTLAPWYIDKFSMYTILSIHLS